MSASSFAGAVAFYITPIYAKEFLEGLSFGNQLFDADNSLYNSPWIAPAWLLACATPIFYAISLNKFPQLIRTIYRDLKSRVGGRCSLLLAQVLVFGLCMVTGSSLYGVAVSNQKDGAYGYLEMFKIFLPIIMNVAAWAGASGVNARSAIELLVANKELKPDLITEMKIGDVENILAYYFGKCDLSTAQVHALQKFLNKTAFPPKEGIADSELKQSTLTVTDMQAMEAAVIRKFRTSENHYSS